MCRGEGEGLEEKGKRKGRRGRGRVGEEREGDGRKERERVGGKREGQGRMRGKEEG